MKIMLFMALLCVFTSCAITAQVSVRNNTGKNSLLYDEICNYVAKELEIKDVEIIISPLSFNRYIYWTDGGQGSIKKISVNTFSINLKYEGSKKVIIMALIHELYHIKQIQDKRLWISDRANWFEGVIYTQENSDYYERPYEIEAEEQTRKFVREHKYQIKLWYSHWEK